MLAFCLHSFLFFISVFYSLILYSSTVEVQSNLSKQQLENATKSFAEKSKKKTALLYYFGHAVQVSF